MTSTTFTTLLTNNIPASKFKLDEIYINKLLNQTDEYDTLIKLISLKNNLISHIDNNRDLSLSIDFLIKVYSGYGNNKENEQVNKLKTKTF